MIGSGYGPDWPFPDPFADDVVKPASIWPAHTARGEYDGDHDRIVCAHCDWYDFGGPTSCAWTYRDHLEAQHKEAP